jgi:acyl-coenzyme A synthetase/AMP-(fatty) acid ligase
MEKNFWNLLKQEEATTFGGVPYVYEMLKRLRFFRMDLPSLKYLTQAGGKLPKELALEFAEECHKKGMKFIVMYGQAEATARMSYLPDDKSVEKAGSIGIAIPGGNFSLVDIDGNEITEPDTVGELVYAGDNVTLGYAESDSDLSLLDENNGRLMTGDMAERDSEGFYYIVGRKKRFLKLFGNRINLQEVEKAFRDAGYDCVCGGVDDLLKIYLTNHGKAEEARAFISQKTGLNMAGFKAIEVDEIPRNEAGKVLYAKLEELYG